MLFKQRPDKLAFSEYHPTEKLFLKQYRGTTDYRKVIVTSWIHREVIKPKKWKITRALYFVRFWVASFLIKNSIVYEMRTLGTSASLFTDKSHILTLGVFNKLALRMLACLSTISTGAPTNLKIPPPTQLDWNSLFLKRRRTILSWLSTYFCMSWWR